LFRNEILFLLLSYLLGSIPWGFVLFYLKKREDIRRIGSGNIGAANVMRTEGKTAGIMILILDMTKGILPVFIGMRYFDFPFLALCGGLAAFLGHLFPLYIKFRGGKGIACFLGIILAFHFPLAFIFAAAFLSTIYFSRYVSAGSISAVTAVSAYSLFTQPLKISIIFIFMTFITTARHYSNFKRIASGTEYHFRWTKTHHE